MTKTLRRKGFAVVGCRARLRVTLKVYVGPDRTALRRSKLCEVPQAQVAGRGRTMPDS